MNASHESRLSSLLLIANLVGFFFISYLPGLFGVDSRVATVPFRASLLALNLIVLWRLLTTRRLNFSWKPTTALAAIFWMLYSLRFFVDAGFKHVYLGRPPEEIGLMLFGTTLPTFLVLLCVRDIRVYKPALGWTMLVLCICCFLAIGQSATLEHQYLHRANDVLNHITYGHMGLTAIILGLFVLLDIGREYHFRIWVRFLSVGAICLGAYSVLAASSRGAFVAGVALLPMVAWLGWRKGSKILTFTIVGVIALVVISSAVILAKSGPKLQKAIYTAAAYSAADASIYNRQNMAQSAWQEYEENPIFGSSLVERQYLSYPHNAIIEAFMATGTFGGFAFTLMMAFAAWRAFALMRRDVAMAWLPICFLQQFISAMFSGGIYGEFTLFALTGIMLGVDYAQRSSSPVFGCHRNTAVASHRLIHPLDSSSQRV
jgi:O-antigen ligase